MNCFTNFVLNPNKLDVTSHEQTSSEFSQREQ